MKVFKMAGILMDALRSKPVTLMYPDAQAKCFESTRGSVDADITECSMCGICAENCPAAAIEIDRDAEQWSIQRMQCVLCGQCVEVCPEGCLSMTGGYSGAETEKIQDVYDRTEPQTEAEAETEEAEEPQAESKEETEEAKEKQENVPVEEPEEALENDSSEIE